MSPTAFEPEAELIDYLAVLWQRRWLILIPTAVLVVAAGVIGFLSPRQWDVDAIIQPSKFFVQMEQGAFTEVVVTDPRQLAGQINQESYNRLIGAELNLDPRKFPKLRAENLRETKLVRVTIRTRETEKAKAILMSLFQHLKSELDRKIDVEIKSITTQIAAKEQDIKGRELDIRSREIEIEKSREEIASAAVKLKISEDRARGLAEEIKGVKLRMDEIEKRQTAALAEKPGSLEALGLLLYANEIQRNYRYAGTLDESLTEEKNTQEDLRLSRRGKEQEINGLKTEIEKIRQGIVGLGSDIDLLNQKKQRIDYAQLLKEPTESLFPVAPKKTLIVGLAGLLGFMAFAGLALFLEYLKAARPAKGTAESGA